MNNEMLVGCPACGATDAEVQDDNSVFCHDCQDFTGAKCTACGKVFTEGLTCPHCGYGQE